MAAFSPDNIDLATRVAELERRIEVEEALERVRARAMAMQHSEELKSVVSSMFKELEHLGIHAATCAINLFDVDAQVVNGWAALYDETGLSAFHFLYPRFDHPMMKSFFEAFERGDSFMVYELAGADKKRWDELFYEHQVGFPVMPEWLETDRLWGSNAFMSHGLVVVWGTAPLDEDEAALMQRFARVVDLTYTRFDDIKQLEAAKARVEATLDHLKTTQAQLVQSEKMASLGQLTAGIAHEIQNPLNFVNNFARLNSDLVSELREIIDVPDEAEELLMDIEGNSRQIAKHGSRAERIVKSMMQHTGGKSERYEVAINPLVDEMINITYSSLQSQNQDLEISIEKNLDESAGSLTISPQEIGRVLQNILGNAFEAMLEKKLSVNGAYEPKLSVITRREKGQVKIRVIDNGPGIPQETLNKIFEPFFTTKPTGSGTGLGLSLSYDIVTQGHGGRLEVESTEGKGATFLISLPIR